VAGPCGGHVDVVVPDGDVGDHFEPVARVEDLGRDLVDELRDQRLLAAHAPEQVVRRRRRLGQLDVARLRKPGKGRGRDSAREKDRRFRGHGR
jgi:type II secretory ATPase GspE/PulE/Tfp pilus assembly ATPase PilB-like protein